jgi:hypothetical protein
MFVWIIQTGVKFESFEKNKKKRKKKEGKVRR